MRLAALLLTVAALGPAGCSLTDVPPPPVALSALDGRIPSVEGAPEFGPTRRSVRLLEAAPGEAILSLHFPDIASMASRFRESHLHDLVSSPDFLRLFQVLPQGMPAAPGLPASPAAIASLLRGEAFLSVEDVGVGAVGQPPEVRVVAGMHLGDQAEKVEEGIDALSALAATGKGVTVEKGTAAGSAFSRVILSSPMEMVLEAAVAGDALFVGLGRDTVTAALERLAEGRGSLEESEAFADCMKRCSAGPQDAVRVFLDLSRIWHKVESIAPEEARRVLSALGLGNIRSLGATLRFDKRELVVTSSLDSPGGLDLFTRLLSRHAVDRRFLDFMPEDASSFTIFSFDAPEALRILREALPSASRASFEEEMARWKESGWDVERDVLQAFGPRCAVVTVPVAGGRASGIEAVWNRILGTAVVLEAPDSDRARAALARLPRDDSAMERRDFTVGTSSAVCYRFHGSQFPPGFALGCALRDGFLVVAFSEEALRHTLQTPLVPNRSRFRQALAGAPEEATMLSFDDPGDGLVAGLELISMGARRGRSDPARERIGGTESHVEAVSLEFPPSVGWTVADENGMVSVLRSATGGFGSLGGLSGLAMIAAVTIPGLSQARLESNEAAAIAFLRSIHKAEEAYRIAVSRDSDGDGEGEYALLGELLGERRGDDRVPPVRPPLLTGFVRNDANEHERAGYLFRVYLPAEDGSPVGSHEKPARLKRVDGDLSETIYVATAWPVRGGTTGGRAFVMDSTGTIYACPGGVYEGRTAPPPDVLSVQPKNLASAPRPESEPSRDGKEWRRVR